MGRETRYPLYKWANRGEITWSGSPELKSRSLPATLSSLANFPPLPKSVLWAPQELACIWNHYKMISSYLRLMFWCHHLPCVWVKRARFYTSLESQGFLHSPSQNITHRWHFVASQSLFIWVQDKDLSKIQLFQARWLGLKAAPSHCSGSMNVPLPFPRFLCFAPPHPAQG